MQALDRGYADPRWGGYRQIQEPGENMREGEKGTPTMYVDFNRRQTARDEQGRPVLQRGRPAAGRVGEARPAPGQGPPRLQRRADPRPAKLRSLATAGVEWKGHERAEALIKASGVPVDHVAGDRPTTSLKDDRLVLSERS